MKKILIVTTVIGTVNAFLLPHIEFLIDTGNKVDVASNCNNRDLSDLKELDCEVYHINYKRNPLDLDNYNAYKDIKELILREQYDLVHVHTPVASTITRIACRNIPNIKVIYTAHGFHFYKGASIKNWVIYYTIEKLVGRWTDSIITMNQEDYERSKKIKKRKGGSVHKVPGVGINLNKIEPQTKIKKNQMRDEYGYKEEDFILFYAAELNGNKNQQLLINVINSLKGKIPNIKLLLAGSGPLEDKYRSEIKKLNLSQNIEILGFRKDIKNLLMLSDIVVASSKREGLPVNIMEAMATGLPVIATDVRGHRDLVKDGENGYVVGVNDVDNFAKAIEKLYKDEELRKEFSKTGRELVKKHSLENILKEMQEIYVLNLGEKYNGNINNQ